MSHSNTGTLAVFIEDITCFETVLMVMRELRRKRRSYQEISVFFKEHLKIPVAPSTLYKFVKSRAHPKNKQLVELPEPSGSATRK